MSGRFSGFVATSGRRRSRQAAAFRAGRLKLRVPAADNGWSVARFDLGVSSAVMKRSRLLVVGLALLSLLLVPSVASAADVYEGYARVGSVNPSYSGRYDIKLGYSKAGYVKASYAGRWDVYEGYSKVGYVTRSYGGRWDLYSGYSKVGSLRPGSGRWDAYQGYSRVGYVKGGAGGPAAGAALLLLVG